MVPVFVRVTINAGRNDERISWRDGDDVAAAVTAALGKFDGIVWAVSASVRIGGAWKTEAMRQLVRETA